MRGMRMKKLCSLLMALVLLAGCALGESAPEFRRMGDAALLPYLENSLYEQLVSDLDSSDYFVENVQAVYISQEYLDELAFNSQENVYFGYTLSELNAQFQGEKYIFTLGENNETVAVPWTDYDDAYDRVIRNVAIGTGVILVCVTVSVVSAGVGAPAVSMIFAMQPKTVLSAVCLARRVRACRRSSRRLSAQATCSRRRARQPWRAARASSGAQSAAAFRAA